MIVKCPNSPCMFGYFFLSHFFWQSPEFRRSFSGWKFMCAFEFRLSAEVMRMSLLVQAFFYQWYLTFLILYPAARDRLHKFVTSVDKDIVMDESVHFLIRGCKKTFTDIERSLSRYDLLGFLLSTQLLVARFFLSFCWFPTLQIHNNYVLYQLLVRLM